MSKQKDTHQYVTEVHLNQCDKTPLPQSRRLMAWPARAAAGNRARDRGIAAGFPAERQGKKIRKHGSGLRPGRIPARRLRCQACTNTSPGPGRGLWPGPPEHRVGCDARNSAPHVKSRPQPPPGFAAADFVSGL